MDEIPPMELSSLIIFSAFFERLCGTSLLMLSPSDSESSFVAPIASRKMF